MADNHPDKEDSDWERIEPPPMEPFTLIPDPRPLTIVPESRPTLHGGAPDARPDSMSRPPHAASQASVSSTIVTSPTQRAGRFLAPPPTFPGSHDIVSSPRSGRPGNTQRPPNSFSGTYSSLDSSRNNGDPRDNELPRPSTSQLPAATNTLGVDSPASGTASGRGLPQPRVRETTEEHREIERLMEIMRSPATDTRSGRVLPTWNQPREEHQPRGSADQSPYSSPPPPYRPSTTAGITPSIPYASTREPQSHTHPQASASSSTPNAMPPIFAASGSHLDMRPFADDEAFDELRRTYDEHQRQNRERLARIHRERATLQATSNLVVVTHEVNVDLRHAMARLDDEIVSTSRRIALVDSRMAAVIAFRRRLSANGQYLRSQNRSANQDRSGSNAQGQPPSSQNRPADQDRGGSNPQGQPPSSKNSSSDRHLFLVQLPEHHVQDVMDGLYNPATAAQNQAAWPQWTAEQLNLGDPARRAARREHYARVRDLYKPNACGSPAGTEVSEVKPRSLDPAAARDWDEISRMIADREPLTGARDGNEQASNVQLDIVTGKVRSLSTETQASGGVDTNIVASPEKYLQRLKVEQTWQALQDRLCKPPVTQEGNVKQGEEQVVPLRQGGKLPLSSWRRVGLRRLARRAKVSRLTRQGRDEHVLRMLSRLTDHRMLLPVVLLHPRTASMILVVVALVLGLYLLGMMLLLQARRAGRSGEADNEDK